MERERGIEGLRAKLEREEYPRLGMLLIVVLTGGCGFLASFAMLHLGLESIALRYPLALCLAYLTFLSMLRIWLRTRSRDSIDDLNVDDAAIQPRKPERLRDYVDGSPFDALDFFDDAGVPLVIIGLFVLAALASLWVVYIAPTLLAELLFDALLAAGLYRRLRRDDARPWLETALRRTVVPFILTLLVLTAVGLAAQHWRPDAHSIGELLHPPATESSR